MTAVRWFFTVCLVLLVFLTVLATALDYNTDKMAPVILVPGLGGTQIEGKWHTQGSPDGCDDNENDWEHLWLKLDMTINSRIVRCWGYRFMLLYDRNTHRCRNQNGVETRVPWAFGSCKPVDELTNNIITRTQTRYWHDVIERLKDSGYDTDTSLKGAGYDWRFAPPQQEEFGYFNQLTSLVEQMAATNKRRVSLIAHSNGGLMLAYFFKNKTQAWKDKHIHSMITMGTPWLGSPQVLVNYLVGTTFGLPHVKKGIMKDVAKTLQTVAYLLPFEAEYRNEVLVHWTLKEKKYTAKDYKQFFTDIKFEDAWYMRQDLRYLFPVPLDKMGVRMVCVWSNLTTHETLKRYQINGEFTNTDSITPIYGEGDRTVPIKSLRYCERFKVESRGFQGPDHSGVIAHDPAIDYVMETMVRAQPFA